MDFEFEYRAAGFRICGGLKFLEEGRGSSDENVEEVKNLEMLRRDGSWKLCSQKAVLLGCSEKRPWSMPGAVDLCPQFWFNEH
nr:hypothetical protein Itr_chr02CG23600 [Ipomoea trifida]GMC61651.1 hypothetical protein Iba_chr02bCG22040 [Ipomoea batatas]GMD86146.1 hypothetical protein Iba_chr14bCG3270 [Ipomoea batatas]